MPATTPPKTKTRQSHVLIVDDDHEITESISYSLNAEGFDVSVATDGNQCIAFAETKKPDLVILDMMMPRQSGFLVMERLLQTCAKPIPIIMITGNEGVRHREYAELLGVSDYINKPFTMDRLINSVNDLLT